MPTSRWPVHLCSDELLGTNSPGDCDDQLDIMVSMFSRRPDLQLDVNDLHRNADLLCHGRPDVHVLGIGLDAHD